MLSLSQFKYTKIYCKKFENVLKYRNHICLPKNAEGAFINIKFNEIKNHISYN